MAGSAFAGTTSKTLIVTATVVDHCAIKSAGPLAFSSSLGIPSTMNGTDAISTSVINYSCTKGSVVPIIRLGQGQNFTSGSTNATPLHRFGAYPDVETVSVDF
jgi:spore coat protein U-like protein